MDELDMLRHQQRLQADPDMAEEVHVSDGSRDNPESDTCDLESKIVLAPVDSPPLDDEVVLVSVRKKGVDVFYEGYLAAFPDIVCVDGQLRANRGHWFGLRGFSAVNPSWFHLYYKGGDLVGFPIYPHTAAAREGQVDCEMYVAVGDVDEDDRHIVILEEVIEWCVENPGWALSINRFFQVE